MLGVAGAGSKAMGGGRCRPHEREGRPGPLKEGLVDFRVVASVLRMGLHIRHNSDDLAPLWRSAAHVQVDLFSERLLVLQMPMYKLLVYKDYPRRGGVIHLSECASTQQRDSRGPEVIEGHHNIACAEPLVRRQIRLTFDSQRHIAGSSCRQVGRNGDGLGARNLLETGNDIPDKRGLPRGILISCAIQSHAGGKEMVCLQPRILTFDKKKPPH